MNESWRLAPWADALYGADGLWWIHRRGVPEFKGAKFTCAKDACDRFPDLQFIECASGGENYEGCNRIITAPGYIGSGGNSGFQAINRAVHLGVRRIVLVGFDMRLDNGVHWHGEHGGILRNPILANVIKWRRIIDEAAGDLAAAGVEVINATLCSALTAYPIMSLEKALNRDRDEGTPLLAEHGARGKHRRGSVVHING